MSDVVTWQAPTPLAPSQRRVFEDLLSYCLPGDGRFWLEHTEPGVKVRYVAAPGHSTEATAVLLDEAHARAALETARAPHVLYEFDGPSGSGAPPSDATWVGPGLRVGGTQLARLVRALDTLLLGLADEVGAMERLVPHLVSWETLRRTGYTRNFPQHLTACAVVREDLRALDRLAQAPDVVAAAAELTPAPVALAPAVCMNLFAGLADGTLPAPITLTARGMCGRYEAGAQAVATRLWSFDMRELVFVGDAAGAKSFRDTMLNAVADLARDVGLPSTLTTASDPFFTSERADLLGYQSALSLKHELRGLPADGSSAVAVTSVNLHKQHFGVEFGITLPDGTPAHSACVGFGLDRWAEWIHGHLGGDPDNWPDVLRTAITTPGRRRTNERS
ncbi:hypothetical protein ACIOEW_38350 [Streptomyces sp. NPDC087901]|uniref:hypothetical protein n=1 Tax=unclassified Streptomyces TaxID=2593676 RepID=UPI003415B4A7